MEIKGPDGTVMEVSSDNRAAVVSASADLELVCAVEDKLVYTLYDNTVTPTGASDYFCKIANTSSDLVFVINGLSLTDAGAEAISIAVGDNFVSATSHGEVEPCSRVPGGPLASLYGQFEVDVDITGHGTMDTVTSFTTGAGTVYNRNDDPWGLKDYPIYLHYGQSFNLLAGTGTAAITNLNVEFYMLKTPLK